MNKVNQIIVKEFNTSPSNIILKKRYLTTFPLPEKFQKGENICELMADLCCCSAETNTIL